MKQKPDQYRFIKEFTLPGIKISAGVSLKGTYTIEDVKLSVDGSSILVNIPLDLLEKYTPVAHSKKKIKKPKTTKEKKTKKTSSESARISDKKV